MATVGVDDGSLQANSQFKVGWLGLGVGDHLALSLCSSNEPSEHSQWPCHDDSIINILADIIIYFRNE